MSAHLQRVERAVAAHPFKVVSAEACPMQEEDDGGVGLQRIVIFWGADPEVVSIGHLVFVGCKCLCNNIIESDYDYNCNSYPSGRWWTGLLYSRKSN